MTYGTNNRWFGLSVDRLNLFAALCEVSLDGSCYFLLFLQGNYAACSFALRCRDGQQNNAKHTWLAMGVRFECTQAFLNLFHMLSNIYWEPNRPAIGLHPDKVQI